MTHDPPLGKSPEPLDEHQLFHWRVLAHEWLDVEEIVTIPPGMVGRITLALLDEIARRDGNLDRTRDLDAGLRHVAKITLLNEAAARGGKTDGLPGTETAP